MLHTPRTLCCLPPLVWEQAKAHFAGAVGPFSCIRQPHDMPRKPLILHVDDDELVAYLLQREITDFEILFLNDGDQALEFLTRSGVYYDAPRPALVLLDLHMPRKDGFQ